MLIRRERSGDEQSVHRIHHRAFTLRNEQGLPGAPPVPPGGAAPVDAPVAEAVLLDLLRQDEQAWLPRLSLVAEEDGRPIGHVVCSRGLLRGRVPALGLGPIAVLPERQRSGVGTALVHAACAAADALDEPLMILLGDPAFYGRTGFVLAERFAVTPPVPQWAPHFQARPLTTFDPQVHHGAFTYAPAFEQV